MLRDFIIRRGLRPLHAAQRRLRPSTRPAIQAWSEGLRFRRRAWGWSRDRKEAWVLSRVREVVRGAAETSFYRDRFQEIGFDPRSDFSFEEFAQLPVLGREEIAEHRGRMRMPGLDERQVREDSTGGSTGQPTFVLKGPQERGWAESGADFFMSLIGCPPGVRTAFLWGHHLDPVGSDRWRDRFQTLLRNGRWFDCFRLSEERLNQYHRDLQDFRPACMLAYAGALAPLAEVVEASGEIPRYPTRCFVTGAEKLFVRDREIVERVFRRPVHEQYGSRDVGLMGFQLDAKSGGRFSVDWAKVLVEPLEEGVDTSILVTKLWGDAMPMIRYRIGDLGRFPVGARPGWPSMRLEEILGREVDRLWLPNGNWFHALGVPHMMKDFPVRDFRLIQEEDYSIRVEIVSPDGLSEESRGRILRILQENLPGLPIKIETCQEIVKTKAGKRRPVISRVRESVRGPGA